MVTWSAVRARTGPTRVSTVPTSPAWTPAASSAAATRNVVVVLPSVPVTPTTARSWLGSPYHQAAAEASAAALRSTTSWVPPVPATGRSTISGSGPGPDRLRGVVVPVGVLAGDGREHFAGPDEARVVGDAADRDHAERRRFDGVPVADDTPEPTFRRQSIDELAERTITGRLGLLDDPSQRLAVGRIDRAAARRGGRRADPHLRVHPAAAPAVSSRGRRRRPSARR